MSTGPGEAAATYTLFDVSDHPPKKLADLSATVESLGLTASTALACRATM